MNQFLKRIIPRYVKFVIKRIIFYLHDSYEQFTGKYDTLTPPKRLMFVGGGDFKEIGEDFLRHFIQKCGLQPHERILDVGCGVGRMAVPLTGYLNRDGSYEGFDIVAEGIRWCKRNISTNYPGFNFRHANILNKTYNPYGQIKASDFTFPYPDESFDFVFATSLFTHMLPADTENYIAEISRVLKKNGRCFLTFFLMNNEAERLTGAGSATLDFRFTGNDYYTTNSDTPEYAICFDETFVTDICTGNSLNISSVLYGSWCGRSNFFSYQDILIVSKNTD